MGQQQQLLIVLGLIIVGIAIAVGIGKMGSQSTESNKDAMIRDLNILAAQALRYRLTPAQMNGGDGDWSHFTIPKTMQKNDNGTYSVTVPGGPESPVTFRGVSADLSSNYIDATVSIDGTVSLTMYGDFK